MSIAEPDVCNGGGQASTMPVLRTEQILLTCGNTLDCEALGQWLRERGGYAKVRTEVGWQAACRACRKQQVDLLIADATMKEFDVAEALAIVCERQAGHLLVLDDLPRDGRLVAVLSTPGASYVSRQAGAAELLLTLEDILSHGRQVFDPALAGRVRRTPKGFQLQAPEGGTSVAQLSKRETEVMLLLAKGATVREVADQLGLSASTVDNHRSRLMRKLDVHKATELTYRAIRDGLLKV